MMSIQIERKLKFSIIANDRMNIQFELNMNLKSALVLELLNSN